jgi:2-keto-4-pentenoate hydratase/2-oxohepta-3-ene-1,7-dioic acid hydratase in catechol pathway
VPTKIIGLWNNFRAAAAKNGWAEPAEPLCFLKSARCAAGHLQTIAAPLGYDGRVACEGESAVVIGRRARGFGGGRRGAHLRLRLRQRPHRARTDAP